MAAPEAPRAAAAIPACVHWHCPAEALWARRAGSWGTWRAQRDRNGGKRKEQKRGSVTARAAEREPAAALRSRGLKAVQQPSWFPAQSQEGPGIRTRPATHWLGDIDKPLSLSEPPACKWEQCIAPAPATHTLRAGERAHGHLSTRPWPQRWARRRCPRTTVLTVANQTKSRRKPSSLLGTCGSLGTAWRVSQTCPSWGSFLHRDSPLALGSALCTMTFKTQIGSHHAWAENLPKASNPRLLE